MVSLRPTPPEPPRDPRYLRRHDDPAWRRWRRELDAPVLRPPGRPSLEVTGGATRVVSVRMPHELRVRAAQLARWRATSLGALVRLALEHYLDEGVGGRYGQPLPVRRGSRASTAPPPLAAWVLPARGPAHERSLAEAYADGDAGSVAEEG